MDAIYNIKHLLDGYYMIMEFEETKTRGGDTFIISAIMVNDNLPCCTGENEKIKFYSDKYLTDYIHLKDPTKKFKILIANGVVNIEGYCKKRVLY
jgi:hypothetical protein